MKNNNRIGIIMCTWNRPKRLAITLDLLLKQTNKNFDFFIWNNNKLIVDEIHNTVTNYKDLININVINSETNVGGFGRFLYAKQIKDKYKMILFIDDDQILDEHVIDKFINSFKEKTIFSWFSWRLSGSYWGRVRVGHGDNADYCGTGGMLIDSSIFNNEIIFKIPQKYLFVEDLWLSFIAKELLGWELYGIDVGIKIIVDGNDQYVKLRGLKNEFYNFLHQNKELLSKL